MKRARRGKAAAAASNKTKKVKATSPLKVPEAAESTTEWLFDDNNFVSKARVGEKYQICQLPAVHFDDAVKQKQCRDALGNPALSLWVPPKEVPEEVVNDFVTHARADFGYNEEQSLGLLFWHKYDFLRTEKDMNNFVPYPDDWSPAEQALFYQSVRVCKDDFLRIQEIMPYKSLPSLIDYYYKSGAYKLLPGEGLPPVKRPRKSKALPKAKDKGQETAVSVATGMKLDGIEAAADSVPVEKLLPEEAPPANAPPEKILKRPRKSKAMPKPKGKKGQKERKSKSVPSHGIEAAADSVPVEAVNGVELAPPENAPPGKLLKRPRKSKALPKPKGKKGTKTAVSVATEMKSEGVPSYDIEHAADSVQVDMIGVDEKELPDVAPPEKLLKRPRKSKALPKPKGKKGQKVIPVEAVNGVEVAPPEKLLKRPRKSKAMPKPKGKKGRKAAANVAKEMKSEGVPSHGIDAAADSIPVEAVNGVEMVRPENAPPEKHLKRPRKSKAMPKPKGKKGQKAEVNVATEMKSEGVPSYDIEDAADSVQVDMIGVDEKELPEMAPPEKLLKRPRQSTALPKPKGKKGQKAKVSVATEMKSDGVSSRGFEAAVDSVPDEGVNGVELLDMIGGVEKELPENAPAKKDPLDLADTESHSNDESAGN